MTTEEEKARAEKVAAARKRVEQMKKQKAKKTGAPSKKDDAPEESSSVPPPADEETKPSAPEETAEEATATSPTQAAPSLAQQSKLRSTSFRKGSISTGIAGPLSPGPFSPDGETAPDIYRKHVARIEELERENKRLTKDASDYEKRWEKAEEELADLREVDGDGKREGGDDKLRNEIAALQRQNAQLQQQVARTGPRHGSSPSVSMHPGGPIELEAQLAAKSATIESMELEMSRLRAQADRAASGTTAEREQIAALEEKLARAEKVAGMAQRELADLRRNLDRTAEKAVREGSERTSAETKLRSLEHDLADQLAVRADLEKKVDGLEKKVATLTTLHKEQDARTQALRREKERAEKEATELKARAEILESENVRLKTRKSAEGGGIDDEGVDELENEERLRLEKKVRDLEAEVFDLRRGVWREKRRELDSPGFQDVDLGVSPTGKKSSSGGVGGIGDFFTSGLNALAGNTEHDGDEDGFLEDEDMEFDEAAFRRAQDEEKMKRIERVKEIKRGLKNWEGWRLDLVETRGGGGEGVGEIFEV